MTYITALYKVIRGGGYPMAQRTVCLYDGKYIGIESIYTVVNGKQINIPDKLKELRVKSKNNELFCPCGCGANLILVAGDKNLREQHFRIKDETLVQNCNMISEGKNSVDSKIVLKCWLDDKIMTYDIESRVQIRAVDDINKKYEFSFLSREKKIALSYCNLRSNLSDEKMDILESNSQGLHVIYVVDAGNGGSNGQYPEGLKKVQNKQGYCLLLSVHEADYSKAKMKAVFYAKGIDELWKEVVFADDYLNLFSIDENAQVTYGNKPLVFMKSETLVKFERNIEEEKKRREEEKHHAEETEINKYKPKISIEEAEMVIQRQIEVVQKRQAEEKRRIEGEKKQLELRKHKEALERNMNEDFSHQDAMIRDVHGNRWLQCVYCGKKAMESEFSVLGVSDHVNLGTCKECIRKPAVMQKIYDDADKSTRNFDHNICPKCGVTLKEIDGKNGLFIGCSNFPRCKYSRSINYRKQ